MPGNTKVLQRRIKSIKNTKKITKAMEMVSVAKMRRATESVLGTRPYSNLAWQIIERISQKTNELEHLFLNEKAVKSNKELVILFSSDKGLCGGFNAQIFKKLKDFLKNSNPTTSYQFIAVGKKGESFVRRYKVELIGAFGDITNKPTFIDIKPMAKIAMDGYINDGYDKVYIAYTDYVSAIVQKPKVRQLLPIIKDNDLGEVGEYENIKIEEQNEYIFEPDKNELLEMLLPKLVETQIYQALLESIASEHSARMVAMKNATDAASDMIDDLQFTFNQLRQSAITQEISEISAGKSALE